MSWCTPSPASASYLDYLVTEAQQLKLDQDPYWRVLLHYRHHWYSNSVSEIKAKSFFNSPQGAKRPDLELAATLGRFFDAKPESGQPAQCLFIDRYQWLKAKLHFDSTQLPEEECADFKNWRAALDPTSITLVFSSYFMGNPSSAFGHTLLRLNHRNHDGTERLLDYGVNYAANPTSTNAFVYGILGLTGGFDGVFSNMPYFIKVAEYNNLESRDLWEYDLNLTQEQIDRMMLHLWTLGHFSTPYYFFSQNCSYMLLTLLDAANPELKLGDEFDRAWAIPSDTVRGVLQKPGLLKSVNVRPSLVYKIKKELKGLDAEEKRSFLQLIADQRSNSELETMSPSRAKKIWDLTLDYLRYSKDKKLQSEALAARANIDEPSPEVGLTPEEMDQRRPDHGHDTARASLGGGYQDASGSFVEIGVRPAFQDLNAETTGYPKGMQIEMMDWSARYNPRPSTWRIEKLNLIKIVSLEPYEPLFRRFSWSARVGAEPIRDLNCADCIEYKTDAGIGLSFDLGDALMFYSLLKADLGFGPNTSPGYRLGPAAEVGVLLNVGKRFSFYGKGSYDYPVLGFLHSYFKGGVESRVSLSTNTDLRLGYDAFPTTTQERVGLNVYF